MRRSVPFGWRASAWQSGLLVYLMNKGADVFVFDDVTRYPLGDIDAFDDENDGESATTRTWMDLDLEREPVALMISLRDVLGQGFDNTIFAIMGVYPDVKREVMRLEAFFQLRLGDDERAEMELGGPSSLFGKVREVVFQRGAQVVPNRTSAGVLRFSIVRELPQSALEYTVNLRDQAGFDYPYLQVEQFAETVAAADTVIRATFSGSGSRRGGCYVASAVYGSYDCPEVWVLRRWRDSALMSTAPRRALVRLYYALSPRLVRGLGGQPWFARTVRMPLDRLVARLRRRGISDSRYTDV